MSHPRSLTQIEIQDRVRYHAPSEDGIVRHAAMSEIFAEALKCVDAVVPPGREKSLAITKIEEAKMWASAGIARSPETR
jgi:hypothetical protein